MGIDPAIDRFLLAAGIADSTRRAYGADLREFARWYGDRPVDEIDVRVLSEWMTQLGRARPRGRLSQSTIARKASSLRAFVRFTLGPDRVPDLPLRAAAGAGCRTPRRRKRSRR
jgi:Site-specific recombinase XerD